MDEIAIIHFSDLHMKDESNGNWVQEHLAALYDAAARGCADANHVILIFSGDIAYSGTAGEYTAASRLLADLRDCLVDRGICEDLSILVTPGNHDHDFASASSARLLLMRGEDSEIDASVLDQLTSTQDSFFDFAKQVESLDRPIVGFDRLLRTRNITCGASTLTVNLINTSWMSMKREIYGDLRWLPQINFPDSGDYVINVLHHPVAWLNPSDAHSLRSKIEQSADLILTGHIHTPAARFQNYISGPANATIEAGCLQENDVRGKSSFHIVKLNLWNSKTITSQYTLADNAYNVTSRKETDLLINPVRSHAHPRLNAAFADRLTDPGHGLNHPRKSSLVLTDFFVMPSLLKSGEESREDRLIKAKDVIDTLTERGSLIIAPETAGKTSFLHFLYTSFLNNGYHPVFATAGDLLPRHLRDVELWGSFLSQEQYEETPSPDIWTTPYERRVLLLDNFHDFKYSTDQIADFLDRVRKSFATVVCCSTPGYIIEELIDPHAKSKASISLTQYQLLEFGHRQRHELVKRWCSIGLASNSSSRDDFERKVDQIDRELAVAIRQSFIPSFPSYLVLMLQAIDASQVLDPTLGSYGQLYQCVINQYLYADDRNVDLETKTNFLAALASWLEETKSDYLSELDIRAKFADLKREYALGVSWEELWRAISKTRLLTSNDNMIHFRYAFVHSYFYALHISQQLDGPQQLEAMRSLVDTIHLDKSSSTLLCLIQHTKDRRIIELLLEKARRVFQDREAIRDLNKRSMFVNDWISQIPALLMADDDLNQARDEQRELQDDIEHAIAETVDDDVPPSNIQEIMTEFSAGYKVVQVIGQILRAFAGSLKAEHKADLCRECFDVALRTLDCFMEIVEKEKDDLSHQIAEGFRETYPDKQVDQIAKETTKRIFFMLETFGVSVFRHVAGAVGNYRLNATLEQVLDEQSSSDRLIDLAIQLDHYPQFPVPLVDTIIRDSESRYTAAITRDLVWLHLHLVETKRELRQRMCEKLGIQLMPKMLYNKEIKRIT